MRLHASWLLGLVSFALTAPLATARAQYSEARVGARIRFEAPGVAAGRYTGTVLQRTADSLLVGSADAPPFGVALARITRMDVSRGRSASAGAKRGFLIGAAVGLVAGVVGSVALLSEEPEGSVAALVVPFVVVTEAVLGGAIGAASGAVVKREVWNGYTPTETRVGVAMQDGTVRVGLQLLR